ncbi:MAG: geranylgeranylglyceryl/heptaprenylglyceryl phosphate synthase [Calditrichaceae bacterium]|jgi:putative glycerol-1-phosphate prenyltransferase
MHVFDQLLDRQKEKKAGYLVLIDPDKTPIKNLTETVQTGIEADVDAFLIGGSLLLTPDFDIYIKTFKEFSAEKPVIIFPGSSNQVSAYADAILFLSLLSGRSAHHIIGTQVLAAPIIHRLKLETISTAYLLVESGKTTAAQFMSGTMPLPRYKPEIAVAHGLAAKYMGFQTIYLEGGSGADHSVPEEMIYAISNTVDLPLIVGGGIRTPETAAKKVEAGASFIVTGNILENNNDKNLLKSFVAAIHQ